MRRFVAIALAVGCASAPAPQPAPQVAAAPPPVEAPPWTRTPPPAPLARVAIAQPVVTRATLDTGLRVLIVEHHRRPIVTVNLVLSHGTLCDPPESAGLTYMAVNLASDFYETMGVNDMPADERSFRQRVAVLGGAASFDAEQDFSAVQIAGYAADAPTYLKLLAEAMRQPRHGARSFEARRLMFLDHLEDLDAESPDALQRLMVQAAFGADHPYARSLIGTADTLTDLELQEVMEQQQVIFVPTGATLLVVGDVEPKRVLAAVRAAFGNWQGYKDETPMPRVQPPSLPSAQRAREVDFVERKSASTLLTCALRPLPEVAGDNPVLQVLAAVLGEGMNSRLGLALREQNGLTYGAQAEIVRRRQASALIACSALKAARGDEALALFRGVFDALHAKPITEDEVQRAKSLRLAELESSADDVARSTRSWIEALTVGTGAPRVEQERAAIEKVTVREVQKLARQLFRAKTIGWIVSGDKAAAAKAVQASGLGVLKPFKPKG